MSQRKTDSNRRNAKYSTGPKTPAGKAISRNNAFEHGLSAAHPVLIELEDEAEFDQYHEALIDELQPVGIMELMLVDQIADAYWRRQRIINLEVGLFDIVRLKIADDVKATFAEIANGALTHVVATTDAREDDMLGRYYRYDARFERSFFRAWKELKALQAARRAEAPEPEQTEETKQPQQSAERSQTDPKPPQQTPEKETKTPQEADDEHSNM